jgi:two-component system response regulator YesN
MVFISEHEIQKLINGINVEKGGYAYILDQDGRLITSTPSANKELQYIELDLKGSSGFLECDINGKEMLVTYTVSAQNGWKYIAAIPITVVMEKADYIKTIVYIVMIGSAILGLVAAYLQAYWNSKPLGEIIRVLKERIGSESYAGENAFDFLQGSISKLIDNNEILQENVKQQLPLLRMTFFD